VSVLGMLKIVDCAIAVGALTTKERTTHNPDRTCDVFTVTNLPFSFVLYQTTP